MKGNSALRGVRPLLVVLAILLVLAVLVALFWNPIFRGLVHPLYTRAKLRAFEAEAETARPGQIVFLGDSVVDSWDLEIDFPEYTVYNRGVMGDAAFHVRQRLKSVYALAPSTIVLLVGTNDFLNEGHSVDQALADYESILAELRHNCPEARVFCLPTFPGYDSLQYKIERWQSSLVAFNQGVEGLCAEYGYVYVDVYPLLLDADTGLASRAYSKDGIHPSPEGYALVAEALKEYFAG